MSPDYRAGWSMYWYELFAFLVVPGIILVCMMTWYAKCIQQIPYGATSKYFRTHGIYTSDISRYSIAGFVITKYSVYVEAR